MTLNLGFEFAQYIEPITFIEKVHRLAAVTMLSMQSESAMAQGFALPNRQVWDLSDFGALPNSARLQTRQLQATIDACTQAGRGTVFIPNGRFLTGTLELKDGVTLHLAPGALLTGSTDAADYPERPFPARDLDVGGLRFVPSSMRIAQRTSASRAAELWMATAGRFLRALTARTAMSPRANAHGCSS